MDDGHVTFGNDDTYKVVGIGNILIKMHDGMVYDCLMSGIFQG